jgi:acetyl-CoA acetyltransferase
MGNTAENVARQFEVSREQQDAFALRSHQKAVAAWTEGGWPPRWCRSRRGSSRTTRWKAVTVDRDEGPRADTTLEKLAALKPVFDPTGTVTAGNSSPLNDGAAAVVLMAADKAEGGGQEGPRLLPRLRRGRRAAGDHGHRPGAGGAQAAGQGPG